MSQGPVLISGAGPTGLIAALSLRKHGVEVRIIDKDAGPRLGERGSGIQPRTLELHKLLGTFDDVNNIGGTLQTRRDYDPSDPYKIVREYSMLPIHEQTIGIPYAGVVIVGQNHHERILRTHLEAVGTKVEFGTELRSFTQSEDSVSVEIVRHVDGKEVVERSEVSYLIGADGAHSLVRKTLGLTFLGETQQEYEMIVGDFKCKGEPRELWERWGDPTVKVILNRPSRQDRDVSSFIFVGNVDKENILTNPHSMIDEFYEISGRRDIFLEEVIWISRYRPNIRMVDKMRVGRVFVAGDAAHCHSPTGGQGMNSGIQDSFNLAWKLALVHKGYAPASLFDSYGEERLPVIADMLNKTTELLKQAFAERDDTESEANTRKDMTQLGVNYRGSSIVYDESGVDPSSIKRIGYNKASVTEALPGDRAPEAPGLIDASKPNDKALSLFGLFSSVRHSVLVFADGGSGQDELQSISEVIKRQPENTVRGILIISQGTGTGAADELFNLVLIDGDDHAHAEYHVDDKQGTTVIIVRPDGVVGARVRSASGIEKYFQQIFVTQ